VLVASLKSGSYGYLRKEDVCLGRDKFFYVKRAGLLSSEGWTDNDVIVFKDSSNQLCVDTSEVKRNFYPSDVPPREYERAIAKVFTNGQPEQRSRKVKKIKAGRVDKPLRKQRRVEQPKPARQLEPPAPKPQGNNGRKRVFGRQPSQVKQQIEQRPNPQQREVVATRQTQKEVAVPPPEPPARQCMKLGDLRPRQKGWSIDLNNVTYSVDVQFVVRVKLDPRMKLYNQPSAELVPIELDKSGMYWLLLKGRRNKPEWLSVGTP
jgi:hypothetical protein